MATSLKIYYFFFISSLFTRMQVLATQPTPEPTCGPPPLYMTDAGDASTNSFFFANWGGTGDSHVTVASDGKSIDFNHNKGPWSPAISSVGYNYISVEYKMELDRSDYSGSNFLNSDHGCRSWLSDYTTSPDTHIVLGNLEAGPEIISPSSKIRSDNFFSVTVGGLSSFYVSGWPGDDNDHGENHDEGCT